ncbi:MAG: hypothetical protein A3J38_00815 [Gammaproteobacteria bacterium RIFCSPHIGHO2_12_FULL_45_9]|nr:MAG: hypothetical protein A3J38_00815 [Gammaproteobacteria bacterium RIFCSPHIGHO2_12_FULL_45_9]
MAQRQGATEAIKKQAAERAEAIAREVFAAQSFFAERSTPTLTPEQRAEVNRMKARLQQMSAP